jgi:hypothetical protein
VRLRGHSAEELELLYLLVECHLFCIGRVRQAVATRLTALDMPVLRAFGVDGHRHSDKLMGLEGFQDLCFAVTRVREATRDAHGP